MSQLPFNPDKINFLEQCGFLIAVVGGIDESNSGDSEVRKISYNSPGWQAFRLADSKENLAVTDLFSENDANKLNRLLESMESRDDKQDQKSSSITLQTNDCEHWLECRIALKIIEVEQSTTGHAEEKNTTTESPKLSNSAFLLICSDVTESHKKAEEHALLSELATTAGSVLKIGYWQLDIATQALYWSDEIYDIHQVIRQHTSPKSSLDLRFTIPMTLTLSYSM